MVINGTNYRDRPFSALFGLSLTFLAISIPKIMIIGIVINQYRWPETLFGISGPFLFISELYCYAGLLSR